MVKNPPAIARDIRDTGLIPGSGRSPGEGNGDPLQCSCLENAHGQRSLASYSPWGGKELDTLSDLVCTHACCLDQALRRTEGRGQLKKERESLGFVTGNVQFNNERRRGRLKADAGE